MLPLAVVAAGCAGYVALLKRAFDASRAESIQALFTLMIFALIALTVIGVWFRGAGMQLGWAG